MSKSNTGQLIILGAMGLAAVYLLTRNHSTNQGSNYYPTQQPPPTTTTNQQNQLLQWAQTQASATTIANIIKGLDWSGIADMWGKIFGSSGSSSGDYSGGGTDVPDNPYSEYDPYNYNDPSIWA